MTRIGNGMVAMALVSLASAADAQVGYEPARSPYRDLDRRHEFTILNGTYRAKRDAARVAPRDGALVGIRYQWLAAGPVNLNAEVSRVESERRVLDPDLPRTCTGKPAQDCKVVGVYRWPLYFADVGLAMNLTGARSYRRLIPEVRGAVGMVTDFHTAADIGDFSFGTKASFAFGFGIRWLAKDALQLRLDMSNRVYTVNYPDTYFLPAPDTSTVLPLTARKRGWMNNPTVTFGVSYIVGR